jgi:hypothetical protein
MHIFPAAMRRPSNRAVAVERTVERSRLIGASVVYRLRAIR